MTRISTKVTTAAKSILRWKNVGPAAFEPVHDLLEGL
jgi:hypothetical protein